MEEDHVKMDEVMYNHQKMDHETKVKQNNETKKSETKKVKQKSETKQ